MSVDAFYSHVGSAVQEARVAARMTQGDLAKALSLSRTSVTNIESGRQRMLIHQLFEIAKALKTPPETLIPPFAGTLRDVILIGPARKRSPRVRGSATARDESGSAQ